MKHNKTLRISLAACALLAAFGAAHAGTITGVRVDPQNIEVGGSATVTVDGQDGGNCALRLEYGNGDVDVTRMSAGKDNFPRTFTHTFSATGSFTVVAKGGKDGSTLGCAGQATAPINVAPATVVAAPPARYQPACPDGFTLNRRSFSRRTGAYSCAAMQGAQLPQSGMACPPGTAYYTNIQGTLLGCRALQ